ncbi:hypothetical protein GCM10022423_10950 [Flavobacterium ginsengiterrae]|uniref:Uncharacterized protein n=1 Tax=Flavobacterium ginsengiterrae TaxID=871695 RepID=A0ABP7GE11_9FLAO
MVFWVKILGKYILLSKIYSKKTESIDIFLNKKFKYFSINNLKIETPKLQM